MLLSPAKKKYLYAIYFLGQEAAEIPSKAIADFLGVKRPSASKMLQTLNEDALIQKEYYGRVQLTADGLKLANRLYTDVVLVAAYFQKVLGLSQEDAMHDALECLCAVSEAGIQKMISLALEWEAVQKSGSSQKENLPR